MSNRTFGGKIIDAGGADNLGADLYSDIQRLGDCTKFSLDIHLDNTNAVGKIYVLESNDDSVAVADWGNLTWDDDSEYIDVTSGVDIDKVYHVESFAEFVAIFYDRTSGDGELDIVIRLKRG